MKRPVIFFVGTGIGRDRRGFESHTIDLFNQVKHDDVFTAVLVKAAGKERKDEMVVSSLSRKSWLTRVLSRISGKHSLVIQQVSFLPGLIWRIYRHRPIVLYLGEPVLFNYLFRWRKFASMKFRMTFYSGGNTVPLQMSENDVLQLVTPAVKQLALQRKILEKQIVLLTHFVKPLPSTSFSKKELRQKLNIPADQFVVLSVGAIDNSVKRMKYLINETSALDKSCYLIMLGEAEAETPEVEQFAVKKLGSENFFIGRVTRHQLHDYYFASDMFILASLSEGFGLVTIEALQHGLPVLVHDYPVTRFVLENMAAYADFSKDGNLTNLINDQRLNIHDKEAAQRRREYVANRFTWKILSTHYRNLLYRSAAIGSGK